MESGPTDASMPTAGADDSPRIVIGRINVEVVPPAATSRLRRLSPRRPHLSRLSGRSVEVCVPICISASDTGSHGLQNLFKVTRTLTELLTQNITKSIDPALDGLLNVTAIPPEKVENPSNALSLYLYHVAEDAYYETCSALATISRMWPKLLWR